MSKEDWLDLPELTYNTIPVQLDSAKDAKEAIKYMHRRQMIKDLYRYYGTSQKKYLAELDKSKPKMIKMLDGIDKKARVEEKEKTVGKEFVW